MYYQTFRDKNFARSFLTRLDPICVLVKVKPALVMGLFILVLHFRAAILPFLGSSMLLALFVVLLAQMRLLLMFFTADLNPVTATKEQTCMMLHTFQLMRTSSMLVFENV